MWSNLKKALEAGRFQLPDRDSLQADLVSAGYKYNSAGQLLIESKQDMRKRGVPSPDEADAVALCFSEPDGAPIPRSKNFNRDLREEYENLYYLRNYYAGNPHGFCAGRSAEGQLPGSSH